MQKSKSDCPICLVPYEDPDRLPFGLSCGHTLCESCLKDLKHKTADKPGVTCPFCNQENLTSFKNFALIEEFMTLGTMSYIKKTKEKLDEQAKLAFIPDGLYKIKAKHSGKYLQIEKGSKEKQAFLVQNEVTKDLSQTFKFVRSNDHYMIIPQHSKMSLQVLAKHSDKSLARILQDNFDGEDHQLWKLEKQDDDSYFLINKKSGKCLDVDLGKDANRTPVIQYDKKPLEKANNQIFYFEKVDNPAV